MNIDQIKAQLLEVSALEDAAWKAYQDEETRVKEAVKAATKELEQKWLQLNRAESGLKDLVAYLEPKPATPEPPAAS